MGSLYKRGNVWWCKYYANGRPIRESTGCAGEREAGRFLKQREGHVADGAPILPRADRIRYDEVAEDLRAHYRATGSRGLTEVGLRFRHLVRMLRLACEHGKLLAAADPEAPRERAPARQEAARKLAGTFPGTIAAVVSPKLP
jgi:hypothetical protein